MVASYPIDRIVTDLLPYGPEKIILFGSAARGDADEHSDIDLIVIKRTNKRFIERLIEAGTYLPITARVDIFVYTPEELEAMIEEGNPFIESALRDGKIVYEKSP
jgi:predicted nucleotidyltransferase